MEGHPVTDVMDPTNVAKVKTPMSCLTCHQPHSSAQPDLLVKDQANNMAFCDTCHKNRFDMRQMPATGVSELCQLLAHIRFAAKPPVLLVVAAGLALASPHSAYASNKKKTTTDTTAQQTGGPNVDFPRSTFPNWSGRSRLPFREYVTPPTSQG